MELDHTSVITQFGVLLRQVRSNQLPRLALFVVRSQAALKSDPERPPPVEMRSLPVERGPLVAAFEDPPRQIGWARVPSYLAAAVVLCLLSITAYATLWSGGGGDSNTSLGGSAYLGPTKLASAPTIVDAATKFALGPTMVDPQPRVTVDGVDFVIVSWELTSTIDTAFADELPRRGAFLVLQAKLTNSRAIANRDAPFKVLAVIDENNEPFAIDKYGTLLANDTFDGAESLSNILLEPGVEHIVYLVFDVPDTSHVFALTDQNGSFKLPIVEP